MTTKHPKVSISASLAAGFTGLHKYKTEKEADEAVLYANQWLKPTTTIKKQEILTDKGKEYVAKQQSVIKQLIKAPSIPTVKSVPVPDDVIRYASEIGLVPDITQDLSVLTLPTTTEEEQDNRIPIPATVIKYYTDVKAAIDDKKEEKIDMPVAASIALPSDLPPDVAQYIAVERGNIAEAPALSRFTLPDLTIKDEQKIVINDKYDYFKLVGKLDGSIYDSSGKLVGIVEVKNRKNRVMGLDGMLCKARDGTDMAYDLRQLACYWACKPNLQHYYLLEVFKGELYPINVDPTLLEKLWEEMLHIISMKCEKLIYEWNNEDAE